MRSHTVLVGRCFALLQTFKQFRDRYIQALGQLLQRHQSRPPSAPLIVELVDALQDLEPGGTFVDAVSIFRDENKRVRIAYVAKPIMLTITEQDRVLILRVVGTEKNLN